MSIGTLKPFSTELEGLHWQQKMSWRQIIIRPFGTLLGPWKSLGKEVRSLLTMTKICKRSCQDQGQKFNQFLIFKSPKLKFDDFLTSTTKQNNVALLEINPITTVNPICFPDYLVGTTCQDPAKDPKRVSLLFIISDKPWSLEILRLPGRWGNLGSFGFSLFSLSQAAP